MRGGTAAELRILMKFVISFFFFCNLFACGKRWSLASCIFWGVIFELRNNFSDFFFSVADEFD